MKFILDPFSKVHLRHVLIVMLAAAFLTFAGAVYFTFDRFEREAVDRRAQDSHERLIQIQMDRRIARIESANASAQADLDEKLRAMTDHQTAINAQSKTAATKSPFPIESILGSIVELICIDNNNRDVYYTGSGTIIESSGLILTNQHLLLSEDQSLIRLCGVGFTTDLHNPPRIEYIGAATAVDPEIDLALLQISEHLEGKALPKAFPAISLKDARQSSLALNLGDPIFIGGYPGIGADTFTFTQGVVSGRVGDELIKTSALIDSGTSGGAAFDGEGRYVGVPTAAARGDIGGSLGYLIAADAVDQFMDDYRAGKNLLPKLQKR